MYLCYCTTQWTFVWNFWYFPAQESTTDATCILIGYSSLSSSMFMLPSALRFWNIIDTWFADNPMVHILVSVGYSVFRFASYCTNVLILKVVESSWINFAFQLLLVNATLNFFYWIKMEMLFLIKMQVTSLIDIDKRKWIFVTEICLRIMKRQCS